jgi:signal transduction histidine kinase
MPSFPETTQLGPLTSAFRAQARRRVAERVPLGLATLLGCAFTGAALEWIQFPDRRLTLLATDALFLAVAAMLFLGVRRRVDLAIVIAVVGVNAIGIGSNLYHWTSGASAERSLLIVTALCSLCAIILPWGWRAQALACTGPVATYILTLFARGPDLGWSGHLVPDGPLAPLVVYPLIVIGLSVLGAELTERYLRSDFVLTRALHERELRLAQATEVAEAASRTKTDFLASMSHEIRTPINVIFGMTDMVLDSELNIEQRSALQRTRAAANTLLVLVNDILDFARIEARKLHLAPRAFLLQDWLRDTLDPLGWRAQDKGLALSWTVADDVPDLVVGDAERLAQVLVNLVTNALKFTHEGSVRVAVGRSDEPGETRLLHFAVADTGVGIEPGQQREIFEAFVQGDAGRTMRTSGAGLGLAICARLVRLMDGRIWVESEPGSGSRFHFTARLLTPAHDAELEQSVTSSAAA